MDSLNLILYFGLGFAVLEWYGEKQNKIWLISLTKPLVMVCIITWILIQVDFNKLLGNDVMFPIIWFVFGMISCLFGDIFLIRSDKYFLPGLLSFLIGHIFYIIGLGQIFPKLESIVPGLILLIMILIVSTQIFIKISNGLVSSSNTKMRLPIAMYSLVISVLLYGALLTLLEREWNYRAALFMAFGALSFYISDVYNAWLRFVYPIKNGRVFVMATYHLAQFSIGIAAVLHYIYRPDT